MYSCTGNSGFRDDLDTALERARRKSALMAKDSGAHNELALCPIGTQPRHNLADRAA